MIKTPLPVTFQKLLGDQERIRIPRLQRDYAQGRTGTKETEIRERFLEDLRDALERPVDDNFAPLNLDFVYGSVETAPEKYFAPLDGQQRLTTIFLLHWLLSWRDGHWNDFTERFTEGGRSRFSYAVRTSSTDFFDMLVVHRPPEPAPMDLKGWITDQPWYFLYWRLDPTIQAVIEMLQAMHAYFAGRFLGELYPRLIDESHPAITFQLLDLGEFPLSDDLYIKMNARGKALTPFETFKASYEQMLPGHFQNASPREIGGIPFPLADFVSRRMDTAWTDFFWAHHRAQSHFDPQSIDESFMNVFRIVALVSRDPSRKETYRADVELLRDGKNPPAYPTFKKRGLLDPEFSTLLLSLMEHWCTKGMLLPPDGPFKELEVFTRVLKNPAELTVPDALIFCGYALFIHEYAGRHSVAEFADWMRVIHNLGINSPDIDSAARLQSPAVGLRELLPSAKAILPRIAAFGAHGRVPGFSDQQQREESLKASLLLADPSGWTELIYQAERHGYFRGQIDFLLEFSGVSAEYAKHENCAWSAEVHERLQQSFLHYLNMAKLMFDENGLNDAGEERWRRALLSVGNYLLLRGNTNFSFLENDTSKPFSWKRLLRGGAPGSAEADRRPFLKSLWDKMDEVAAKLPPDTGSAIPTSNLLDAVIGAATNLPPWRAAFVQCAAAVAYCCTVQYDWNFANQVYLLATTQRKGRHAELFTFVAERQLREADARQPFPPLSIGEYHYSCRLDDPPHLPVVFPWAGAACSIDIYGRDGILELWIELPPPDLIELLTQHGFTLSAEYPGWFLLNSDLATIEPTLRQLAGSILATL